jgi:lipoic acid synthetase
MRKLEDSPRAQENRRHLPVVGQFTDGEGRTRVSRHPPWIKAKLPAGDTYMEVRRLVHEQKLHTVCESASCPNIGECWNHRALTIMILGGICTRSCQFCDVPNGRPLPVDPDEPRRVAHTLAQLGLRHTVITSVDRDDLDDGGAAHWAETIRRVREACCEMTLEVLTGDFQGNLADVDTVLAARPHIFSHNLETVPRLSRQVRVQARYDRSLAVLAHAKQQGAIVKTGLMLGLGEELSEVYEVLDELARMKLDIVTFGQYLRPSLGHLPIARHVHPDEFAELKARAVALGFPAVEAGPLVRSSYHADQQARELAIG